MIIDFNRLFIFSFLFSYLFVFMHQIPKAFVKICLYILTTLIQIKGVGNFFKINSDL